MGQMRPLAAQATTYVLRWQARRGRRTAEGNLDLLALALRRRGWHTVRLYRTPEFPIPLPLLWVYAGGPHDHAGLAVSALPVQGGGWGYHDARRGRRGYLGPCHDTEAAAEQVESLLEHRMLPDTR